MDFPTCDSAPRSINVRVIDDQHAALIERIARVEQALAVENSADALPQIIRDVREYAASHCPTEERLMEAYGYPLHDMHAMEHQKFFMRLDELERIAAEGHPAAAIQMLSRLRAWLESHHLRWDAKLGEFLNSRGVN
jgi:hemerythrin